MGDPNATATPAALAAVKISLILAVAITSCYSLYNSVVSWDTRLTMTRSVLGKHSTDDATDATGDMHRGTLFAHRKP